MDLVRKRIKNIERSVTGSTRSGRRSRSWRRSPPSTSASVLKGPKLKRTPPRGDVRDIVHEPGRIQPHADRDAEIPVQDSAHVLRLHAPHVHREQAHVVREVAA